VEWSLREQKCWLTKGDKKYTGSCRQPGAEKSGNKSWQRNRVSPSRQILGGWTCVVNVSVGRATRATLWVMATERRTIPVPKHSTKRSIERVKLNPYTCTYFHSYVQVSGHFGNLGAFISGEELLVSTGLKTWWQTPSAVPDILNRPRLHNCRR
jgi:hypothetical protein